MLPEAITRLAGQAGEVVMMEVERGAIKRYAHATGDLNPLYLNEEYARNSRYGGMVAMPGFFGWPTRWTSNVPGIIDVVINLVAGLKEAGFPRLLDGGVEYEFFAPVRAGDVLAMLPRIIRITERGKLVFSVVESTYTNQSGVLVAKARQTLICVAEGK